MNANTHQSLQISADIHVPEPSLYSIGRDLKALFNNTLVRLGAIGNKEGDSEEEKMRKTLLVAFASSMGSMGILWGSIYILFDEPLAGAIPLSYSLISLISLWIFSRIKCYKLLRISQLCLSLILPFLLMLSLGGFAASSGVVMWALTCPLGALLFTNRASAIRWFIAYILLVIGGIGFEPLLVQENNLTEAAILGFFVLNISGVSVVAFILVYYFVGERNLVLRFLENKHKWIKEAFSAYVSPNLVDYLIKHPEELKLGGERRECTFVFTDLSGFTSLVEESDPTIIVSVLNEYIEEMTKIAFKHQGTIDKIVGDGMAVIFSAPLIQEDHAERGVKCALEMDAFSKRFAAEKRTEGIMLGHTRIGVNTGTVIVGNVGSKSQFDYRAIGDAVNTASRLEGANKYLGTNICISQRTVEKYDDFDFRPIGSLILKGKTEAVEVVEAIEPENRRLGWHLAYYDAFQLLERKSPEALAAFVRLREVFADDELIAFHLNRLQSGKLGSEIVLEGK